MEMSIVVIILGLLVLFALFYLGQKMHCDLLELSDMIYQSDWYRYPRSVRRFVLLMILRSQQPVYLSAYGIMRLNLVNFVNVNSIAYLDFN